jgi:predicted HD phosphohydrolase
MTPEQITALFAEHGDLCYEGEGITQLQHTPGNAGALRGRPGPRRNWNSPRGCTTSAT